LAIYEKAAEIDQENKALLIRKGNCEHAIDQYGTALASHENALALNPDDEIARYDKSLALHATGRDSNALAAIDESSKTDAIY
jgi:tetratricopeptide (TPR) repeat protein